MKNSYFSRDISGALKGIALILMLSSILVCAVI